MLLAQLEKDLQPGGASKWRGRFILRAQEGWLLDTFHLEHTSKSPADLHWQPAHNASISLSLLPGLPASNPKPGQTIASHTLRVENLATDNELVHNGRRCEDLIILAEVKIIFRTCKRVDAT